MSVGYRAIQWNRHKLVYDATLLGAVALYLGLFLVWPSGVTWEIREIRASGSCAFLMLTVILCIGPAARLDPRVLPLLYNRRHFGVMTCAMAFGHAWFVLGWYHTQGKLGALLSVLASSDHWSSFVGFPFEIPGILALLILFAMAATSHDFWLQLLGPPIWKSLHMLVYAGFGLAVGHVALGTMQSERSILVPGLVIAAAGLVSLLHVAAARAEARPSDGPAESGWIDIGPPDSIPDGRARIIEPPRGERIAVFRHDGFLSAVTNVCAHQNGPLGEGRILDGCITCPWHGHQFRPEDGCSPPPFTDKVATHRLKRVGRSVLVETEPLPPGTPTEKLAVEPS
jgi:nitrite reductase/ring-hydroxylating ferredoxin subunit/DMSO/TMAO reductase YedYZ heme-binding membrane subunit